MTGWSDGLLTLVSGSMSTTSNNTANWDQAYTWTNAGHTNWDAVYASSTNYDSTYNIVDTGHTNWDTAYSWGDHSTQNYFSTSSSVVLEIIHGGTGANNTNGARTNLGLAIGSDVQAYNSSLDDISGLATTANLFMVANGTNWATQDESTVRSTLGLTTAYANQTYMISSDGTSGQIWTSDGSGAGTWTATSSLGLDNYNYWTASSDSGSSNISSLATFTISGGSGLSTAISGNTLTLKIESGI